MASEPTRYFIVHLQKTAGTSLRDRFRSTFDESAIYPNAGDGRDKRLSVISLAHEPGGPDHRLGVQWPRRTPFAYLPVAHRTHDSEARVCQFLPRLDGIAQEAARLPTQDILDLLVDEYVSHEAAFQEREVTPGDGIGL